jgi:ATP-dependent Lon protease
MKIYRKAALKLVQDLGEDVLPEPAASSTAQSEQSEDKTEETSNQTVVKIDAPVNEPAAPETSTPKHESEEKERKVTTVERKPMKIPDTIHVRITPENLKDYVGPPVYYKDRMYTKAPPPGVSTGLGYLGNGSGAVMPIEASVGPSQYLCLSATI